MTNSRLHLIVGIGTELRGDDAAGLAAARLIRNVPLSHHVRVLELCGDAVTLMHAWKGVGRLSIIDAMEAGMPPGSVVTIDPWQQPVPARAFVSSHLLGLAEAIEISMSFNEFPRSCTIYGIQGGNFGMRAGISAAVSNGVEEVVRKILQRIEPFELSVDTRKKHA